MRNLENLDLATGSITAQDLAALLPQKIARDINRYVAEQSWGRKLFTMNRDLVGATGLTISYPLKEKSIAMKLSDGAEILNGQGEWATKSSETFMVGARAEWSYAAEEARMHDLMAEEVKDALAAIAEYENKLVYDRCVAGVVEANAFAAATPGAFAYADLIKMRRVVQGPMDYVVVHPTQMADVLSEDKFLRGDFITTIRNVEPSTTVFETKLGFTFLETEQATEGVVVGVNSKRAGRFTVKKDVTRVAYDKGKGSGGALYKGVTLWELIDAVVLRGDSVAKCTVGG